MSLISTAHTYVGRGALPGAALPTRDQITPLKKTYFLYSHKLPIGPQQGVEILRLPHIHAGMWISLVLCVVATVPGSVCVRRRLLSRRLFYSLSQTPEPSAPPLQSSLSLGEDRVIQMFHFYILNIFMFSYMRWQRCKLPWLNFKCHTAHVIFIF